MKTTRLEQAALPPPRFAGRGHTLAVLAVVAVLALLAIASPARAAGSLTISLDRAVVAPGEEFTCEVTVAVANEQVEGYRPPDFKGLRVLSTPQFPSRSTQMQIGGGQTFVQNSYSWTYALMVPPGAKGPFTIGGAQVRVSGREVRSNAVTVRVGAVSAGGRQPSARQQPGMAGGFPFDILNPGRRQQQAVPASDSDTFIRVVADKTRAFVGEPVVVSWTLYTTVRPDKFETVTEARTDGFWSETLPSAAPPGRLLFTAETLNGRSYQSATLIQKALFPLREGKLTISPMEAEIAQVDFFGTALRTQRLKADPVTIEAMPLPREGQPAGFDPANAAVGKYTLSARADRTTVTVGEAVTVSLELKGAGNVRKAQLPALPTPEGWKSYPPKETVTLDAAGGIGGTKVAEVLLLPERPGTVMLPSVELATFDPEARRYVTLKSDPLRLDVTGEASAAAARAPGAAGPAVENVVGGAIRPIRARTRLSRDVGTTFLQSRAFPWLLFLPPFALVTTALVERVRDRLATDTRRTRRRRMRSMVRRRLDAAVAHREAGRASDFYIEIDRVLRDVLAARLGRSVTGLRHDELTELLTDRGMSADATARVVAELEACDLARFAPGGETDGAAAMAAALERADELIGVIEKAPLREEAGT